MICSIQIFAQIRHSTVACGERIKQEFNAGREEHDITIRLEAGDTLSFKVVPAGDYLNVRAEIWDPAHGRIFPEDPYRYTEPMFKLHARTLEITTGRLSANGTYIIKLFNHYKVYRKDEKAGEYTFSTVCTRRDGTMTGN